jgi:CDP-glucose 4,6-dehydratase
LLLFIDFSILLVNMNTDFWLNKTVLVTGHTGFKGSWLSLWLQQLGANVIGYSLKPPTWPNLYHEAQVSKGIVCIEGDVRDLRHLQDAMETHQPEIVFHLAGQSLVRHSYKYPVETFDINVMGTVNVLESIRLTDCVRSAVMVTTDKCYENREWAWGYRENDSLGGREPYSSSKSCAELAIAAYRDAYFDAEVLLFED